MSNHCQALWSDFQHCEPYFLSYFLSLVKKTFLLFLPLVVFVGVVV